MFAFNTIENSPYREVFGSKKPKQLVAKLKSNGIKAGNNGLHSIKAKMAEHARRVEEMEEEKEIANIKEYMQRKIYEHYKQQLLMETKRKFVIEIERRFAQSQSNKNYTFPRLTGSYYDAEDQKTEFDTESLNQTIIDLNDQNIKNYKRTTQQSFKSLTDSRTENNHTSFETTTAGLQNKIKNKMIQESGKEDLFKTTIKSSTSRKIMPNLKLKNIISTSQEEERSSNSISFPHMKQTPGKLLHQVSQNSFNVHKKNDVGNRPQGNLARKNNRIASSVHSDYDQYYRSLIINGVNEFVDKTVEEGKNLDSTLESKRTFNTNMTNTSYQSPSKVTKWGGGLTLTNSPKFTSNITPRSQGIENILSRRLDENKIKSGGFSSTNMKIESRKLAVTSKEESSSGANSISITNLMAKVNKVLPEKRGKLESMEMFIRNKIQKGRAEKHNGAWKQSGGSGIDEV